MVKFEFKTSDSGTAVPQTIEADDYNMDMAGGKLTFFSQDHTQLASFAIGQGAYVRMVGK